MKTTSKEGGTVADDFFSTDTEGLPEAAPTSVVRLHGGDRLDLRISPVRKRVGGDTLRMLAYNGSIPGPTLHVDQGSELTVEVLNQSDLPATVHWHGLRLDNRYDGVAFETQPPIPIGDTYTQEITFPDAGLYWYHPHIREDYGIELGLYGTVIVEPSDLSYWPPIDRQVSLTLDDLLVEDGKIAPFRRSGPTFTAMGRFGNVMLINGETEYSGAAAVGDVVRLHVVNTANTRMFRFGVRGARMKLVGGDSGRYEREAFVDDVLLAPSERAIVDVLFHAPGDARLEHRTPDHVYDLGAFSVGGMSSGTAAASFDELRSDPELSAARAEIASDVERAPDKVLAFWSEMPHEPGVEGTHASPPAHAPSHHGREADVGIEWEDDMVAMNRATDQADVLWQLIDRETGAKNGDISWKFTVGDRVKIRLVNEMDSDHPMPHPFHVHGAGRFLILARDGKVEPNLAWKDTVLVLAGQTVDILLYITNPGVWMAHCHIAEHNQAGMMFSFEVAPGLPR
jgi:FtsP/CotA-like multicopper oxidase with cupredoxin domain